MEGTVTMGLNNPLSGDTMTQVGRQPSSLAVG
jgi:hypothetical protein